MTEKKKIYDEPLVLTDLETLEADNNALDILDALDDEMRAKTQRDWEDIIMEIERRAN